jgi:predicted metal-binding membrane protein
VLENSKALAQLDRRDRRLIAALLAAAALAWIVTADRMSGMDTGPGTDLGSLGFFVGIWVVMMAAMMFPSVAPTAAAYETLRRPGRAGRWPHFDGSATFLAGYLLSWTLFGLIAYALFELVASLEIEALGWDRAGRFVAAAVLALAAAYELTPLKHACLARCRNPIGFLVGSWRGGPTGAVRLGALNGAWCIGCCWALVAVLFALGLMSVAWMLVVAAMVAAEKLLPWRHAVSAAIVAVLLALAAGVAFAPDDVPALTVPGSAGDPMNMNSPMPD